MLNEQAVEEIIAVVGQQGLSEATIGALRNQFGDAHFTYCMDDDVGEVTPYRECEGFNIYLVNSEDHCSVLTRQIEGASGMVLAEVIDD